MQTDKPAAPALIARRAALGRIALWAAFIPLVLGPTSAITARGEASLPTVRCPEQECSWLYNPEIGDPDGGIPAGVAFEDLPDDWECPECGTPKYLW